MQVPVFTTCYVRSQSAQDAGRVATGFPLPSTGRGIEGEGWSYPEPPPVRFFLYQPHPGSRLETEHAEGAQYASTCFYNMLHRCQRSQSSWPRGARPKNPRNITFYGLKPPATMTQRVAAHPTLSSSSKTPAITLFTRLNHHPTWPQLCNPTAIDRPTGADFRPPPFTHLALEL